MGRRRSRVGCQDTSGREAADVEGLAPEPGDCTLRKDLARSRGAADSRPESKREGDGLSAACRMFRPEKGFHSVFFMGVHEAGTRPDARAAPRLGQPSRGKETQSGSSLQRKHVLEH